MARKDKNAAPYEISPEELEGIKQGLREFAEGKVVSLDEIESELATKYNRVN